MSESTAYSIAYRFISDVIAFIVVVIVLYYLYSKLSIFQKVEQKERDGSASASICQNSQEPYFSYIYNCTNIRNI